MPESRQYPDPDIRIHDDKILILDFGAQYTQLIARRVRELGVYCEIWAWDHDPGRFAGFGARGIILSGGPESTTLEDAPSAPQAVFDAGVPVLGICYGMQTLAAQFGGATESADAARVRLCRDRRHRGRTACFEGLDDHDGAGTARRMDEPRRPRRHGAARFEVTAQQRARAGGGHGQRDQALATACSSTPR